MLFRSSRLFSIFALCVSSALSAQGTVLPFLQPLEALVETFAPVHNERNLIMILDVKQQESYFGACGYSLAAALQDKIAPIIASKHALMFVTAYFRPSEWHIYQKANLILFIPKDYLKSHNLSGPEKAGFDLGEWSEIHPKFESLSGAELYTSLPVRNAEYMTFSDLSHESLLMIKHVLRPDLKNSWKIYAAGHGAPDAHQVCGLNLNDFKKLLSLFNTKIKTDYLVYETCFGGGKKQLRDVYLTNQNIFATYNYPIISGSLTNSVSFGVHPQKATFKGIFSRVNNSTIIEKKAQELLKAMNEISKCLWYASDLHWTNNLLLLRMPGSEYFEPVIDNQSVFAMRHIPQDLQTQQVIADAQQFKCVLAERPTINQTVDLSSFNNFIIASGTSRSKHYIKELIVSSNDTHSEVALEKVVELFGSLAFPEKGKIFYIDTLHAGSLTYKNVTITQLRNTNYNSEDQFLNYKATIDTSTYRGQLRIVLVNNKTWRVFPETVTMTPEDAAFYSKEYMTAVNKHLAKTHVLPFFIPQLLGIAQ